MIISQNTPPKHLLRRDCYYYNQLYSIIYLHCGVFRSCNRDQGGAAGHELRVQLLQEAYKISLKKRKQYDRYSSWQMLCLLAEVPCAENPTWARERDPREAQWHMWPTATHLCFHWEGAAFSFSTPLSGTISFWAINEEEGTAPEPRGTFPTLSGRSVIGTGSILPV